MSLLPRISLLYSLLPLLSLSASLSFVPLSVVPSLALTSLTPAELVITQLESIAKNDMVGAFAVFSRSRRFQIEEEVSLREKSQFVSRRFSLMANGLSSTCRRTNSCGTQLTLFLVAGLLLPPPKSSIKNLRDCPNFCCSSRAPRKPRDCENYLGPHSRIGRRSRRGETPREEIFQGFDISIGYCCDCHLHSSNSWKLRVPPCIR